MFLYSLNIVSLMLLPACADQKDPCTLGHDEGTSILLKMPVLLTFQPTTLLEVVIQTTRCTIVDNFNRAKFTPIPRANNSHDTLSITHALYYHIFIVISCAGMIHSEQPIGR